MDQVRQRLKEIRQKQLEMQEKGQAVRPSSSSNDKSLYSAALGGVAAGLTIAAMIWLAKSLLTTEEPKTIYPNSNTAIHAIEIRRTNEKIQQLTDRIELLTESITTLGIRLNQAMELTSSTNATDMKQDNSFQKSIPESASNEFTVDVSDIAHLSPNAEDAFVTTHTVKTRLNLRSSPSLEATTLAILGAGTEVEYIRENDGWYYVNTERHGKGWCASEYLLPSPDTQQ
jgi:hypothetical protein